MYFIFTLFFSGALSADDSKISFKSEAHLTQNSYYLEGSSNGKKIKCEAYGKPRNEGVQLRLVSPQGVDFSLSCRGQEVGDRFDLLISKKPHDSMKIQSVVSKGGDCDATQESQAWLKDLNGDKEIDLLTRSKYKKVDGACGGSGSNRILTEDDELKVYYWTSGKMVPAKLSHELQKQYMKEYNFSF